MNVSISNDTSTAFIRFKFIDKSGGVHACGTTMIDTSMIARLGLQMWPEGASRSPQDRTCDV